MGSSAGLTGKVWGVLCDCRLLLQGLRGWWAGAAWPVKGGPWGPQEGQQGVCQGGVTPPRPPPRRAGGAGGRGKGVGEEGLREAASGCGPGRMAGRGEGWKSPGTHDGPWLAPLGPQEGGEGGGLETTPHQMVQRQHSKGARRGRDAPPPDIPASG